MAILQILILTQWLQEEACCGWPNLFLFHSKKISALYSLTECISMNNQRYKHVKHLVKSG